MEELKPQRAFFTHISHDLPHRETNKTLPEHVRLAHDGLKLEFEIAWNFPVTGGRSKDFGPTIVSVGNFDGIHCGHLSVLKEITERARKNHSKAIAVTFEPHPLRILRSDMAPRLITPPAKKEAMLAQTGLDALLNIPFTRDFSMTTQEEFARDILAGKLHAKEVHEGDNFHFGHNAEGNTASLKELGKQFGFEVRTYPVMMVRGIPVSSSQIRALLLAGKVSMARRLLGRVFSITGAPGRGRGYGHKYHCSQPLT